MSQARQEGFVVRVLRAGSPVAARVGFVVGERHILTCAYVVNTVLGRGPRTQEAPEPGVLVQVDFPLLGDAEGAPLRSCRVAAWVPPPVSGTAGGDVAGLVLAGEGLPAGAGPARLAQPGDVRSAEVAVFGYPGEPPRRQDGAVGRLSSARRGGCGEGPAGRGQRGGFSRPARLQRLSSRGGRRRRGCRGGHTGRGQPGRGCP
ncbi:MAG: trypsin-like peptidase domain-containing protein [Pseudonocardiales bacterium]|nr:trypsin-like peptidase domain-containing protein [Pseudonocardiales bacterium]